MRIGLERLAKGQEDSEERISRMLADHEERLRRLDARVWALSTISAAVGAGGGFGLERLTGG
jgi:hypothetical protein